jgi:uncharacterized protein HemY
MLANQSKVYYWLGVTCEKLGDRPTADHWLHRAASQQGDFQQMAISGSLQ